MLLPGSLQISVIMLVLITSSLTQQSAPMNNSKSIATSAFSASQILRDWFESVTEGIRYNNKDNDGPSNVAEFSHDYLTADRLVNWLRDQTRLFGHFASKAGLVNFPKTQNSPVGVAGIAVNEKSADDKNVV